MFIRQYNGDFDKLHVLLYQAPKLVHQIWFDIGKDKPYGIHAKCQRGIRQMNPDYVIVEWNAPMCETLLTELYSPLKEFYDILTPWIAKVDFMKFVLLYTYGGFFIDTDITTRTHLDNIRKDFPGEFMTVPCHSIIGLQPDVKFMYSQIPDNYLLGEIILKGIKFYTNTHAQNIFKKILDPHCLLIFGMITMMNKQIDKKFLKFYPIKLFCPDNDSHKKYIKTDYPYIKDFGTKSWRNDKFNLKNIILKIYFKGGELNHWWYYNMPNF